MFIAKPSRTSEMEHVTHHMPQSSISKAPNEISHMGSASPGVSGLPGQADPAGTGHMHMCTRGHHPVGPEMATLKSSFQTGVGGPRPTLSPHPHPKQGRRS